MRSSRSLSFPLLALLVAPGLAFAQTAPGGGQLLRETQPRPVPAAPSPAAPALEVAPPPAAGASGEEDATVAVRSIGITGNTVIASDTLHALVAEGEGRTLTLAQLEALAARVTQAYQTKGFILARAYLPAQEITDGHVVIAVQEGRLGEVKINNAARVSDATAASFFTSLNSGDVISVPSLEAPLLLLADTPGVATRSTMAPGAEPGTADLVVTTTAKPLFGGRVTLDNHGGDSTGSERLGAILMLASPFQLGDQLTLQGLTSLNSGQHLRYGRIGYDLLLNGRGTRLGASYARLDYGLGQNFAALDATGTADVGTLTLTHPLVRTRSFTLQALATYDYKVLKDEIAIINSHDNRDIHAGAAGFNGTLRDKLFGGGITFGSLLFGVSNVDFTDSAAEAADAAGARTRGSSGKLTAMFERQQRLGETTVLRLAFNGQLATGNLDSSDKFSLGGPDSVRAYPQGEVSGDDGYVFTAELLQALPFGRTFGDWQAVAFYDGGQARINHDAFAPGDNTRALSGAGVGLRWSLGDQWSARADAAWRIDGGAPGTDSDRAPRIWASLAYGF